MESIEAVTTSSIEPGRVEPVQTLGRGEDADEVSRPALRSGEDAAGVLHRAAGRQHRVEHEHVAAVQVGRHRVHVRLGLERLLVAGDADEAGRGLGHEVQDRAEHPEPGPQHGNDERRVADAHASVGPSAW